jgi:hypothetical protein
MNIQIALLIIALVIFVFPLIIAFLPVHLLSDKKKLIGISCGIVAQVVLFVICCVGISPFNIDSVYSYSTHILIIVISVVELSRVIRSMIAKQSQ